MRLHTERDDPGSAARKASNTTASHSTPAARSILGSSRLLDGLLLSRLVPSGTEQRTVARQRLSHEHVGSLEAAHTDATVIGPLAIQLAGHRLAEHPSRASQPSPRPRPEHDGARRFVDRRRLGRVPAPRAQVMAVVGVVTQQWWTAALCLPRDVDGRRTERRWKATSMKAEASF